MRVLSTKDIPRELWKDQALQLPKKLQQAYWQLATNYKITEDILSQEDISGVIGGPTKELTLQHFSRRYGVSYCRIESLVIDPNEVFSEISDDLILKLSEGEISILDVACGTGAVGASILCTITALRDNNVIPKLPMKINLVGGDCSDTALVLYGEMIQLLKPYAKSVGIEVDLKTIKWQAESSYTTSEMFDQLYSHDETTEQYLVIIANFAGTLSSNFSQFQDSIRHIFDRTSNKKCAIVWVESWIKSAGRIFEKLGKLVAKVIPWSQSSQDSPVSYKYMWYHPFQKRKLDCCVLVKEYKKTNNRDV